MSTSNAETITNPVDLTVELRSADGTSKGFYQTDEERIRKTLHSLATPQLLMQPRLVLASELSVSTIPCRSIDMILARTSARTPQIFPLIFPAGLLDIAEVHDDWPGGDAKSDENRAGAGAAQLSPLVSDVEIHTVGGWGVALRVLAMARATVRDQRQSFTDLFDLPVIPFRLLEGGIGLINPNNITTVSARPPGALPETALPMDLLRWTPLRF